MDWANLGGCTVGKKKKASEGLSESVTYERRSVTWKIWGENVARRLNFYKDPEVDKLGGLRSSNKTSDQEREWKEMMSQSQDSEIVQARPSCVTLFKLSCACKSSGIWLKCTLIQEVWARAWDSEFLISFQGMLMLLFWGPLWKGIFWVIKRRLSFIVNMNKSHERALGWHNCFSFSKDRTSV